MSLSSAFRRQGGRRAKSIGTSGMLVTRCCKGCLTSQTLLHCMPGWNGVALNWGGGRLMANSQVPLPMSGPGTRRP